MRYKFINSLLLLIILILVSCTNQKKYNYHDNISHDQSAIAKIGISKSTETKIQNDSNGNAIWKRVEKYRFFNEKGLCIKEIKPAYEHKFSDFKDMIGVETINYLGFSDTIYNEYDKVGHLIKRTESTFDYKGNNYNKTTEFKYNGNGNLTSECTRAENSEIQCIYSEYKYGSDKQIISRKDSTDFEIEWDLSKPFDYKYDEERNLVYDGKYLYVINKAAKTIEMIPKRKFYEGIKYSFDKSSRKIKETRTFEVEQNWKEGDETLFFKYDSRELLVETKVIIKGKIKYLLNYTYHR